MEERLGFRSSQVNFRLMAEYNISVSRLTNCIRDLQAIELLSVKNKI